MTRRITLAVLVLALSCAGTLSLAVAATSKRKPSKPSRVHGLAAPALVSPANGAQVEQIPVVSWSGVAGAAQYEYQVSADPAFHSIAIGTGTGNGMSVTHNLAAALSKTVTDGTYYWRVRGLTASKAPGPWSRTRTLVKAWTAAPHALGPANEASIAWPSNPLVLSWTPVPSASEYLVTIATDPALSNIVLGSATSPQKTAATVFALPGTLHAGQYYWAITPVDAAGHRGTPSAVQSFTWSWPTGAATTVSDLNPDPRAYDPQLIWGPVPGAARYEVEVNSAEGFPLGSKWCCSGLSIGTSLSPTTTLANNGYYWRVRAIDANGNAGQWNMGPAFTKAFDAVNRTVPDLTMRDAHGNTLPAGTSTDTPIVTWSAVAGAASYELQAAEYVKVNATESACSWVLPYRFVTSTLAWTPGTAAHGHIGPTAWPQPHSNGELPEGRTYCIRVLARSDRDGKGGEVISEWTSLGGEGSPAFTFANQPAPEGELSANPVIHYVAPGNGASTPRTPLFTWERVAGASSYYVVIARDAGFTHVLDVASTSVPAYAPPLIQNGEEPLVDETTSYYWAVVPFNALGREFAEPPSRDQPQSFNKSSVPPTPLTPYGGSDVEAQPTFSWTPAEGALNYTLQVSADPTFGSPLDNITTDSSAYTSTTTYPANTTLYWRVRANNANGQGLNWSPVQTFTRTLPVPVPSPANPGGGQGIPVLSWSPVPGAIAYNMHVEQADGTTKDFTSDSTSFTPTVWYGTGIWRWQVRAQFPSSAGGSVYGSYFASQPFVHTLAPPSGVSAIKAGSRITIAWSPDPYAKEYEVDFSTSETFNSTLESKRVQGLGWAPNIDLTQKANKGRLYWRVAAVDQGNNVGGFATGVFLPPPASRAKCTTVRAKTHGKPAKKRCPAPKRAAKKHR